MPVDTDERKEMELEVNGKISGERENGTWELVENWRAAWKGGREVELEDGWTEAAKSAKRAGAGTAGSEATELRQSWSGSERKR